MLEAGLSGLIPLKYVDKLEKRLSKKMGVSAQKMNKYKNRMQNDGNRSRSTQARNERKFNEFASKNDHYKRALIGVKSVNDAFKSGGAEALTHLELYKKVENRVKEALITIGEIDNGQIVK